MERKRKRFAVAKNAIIKVNFKKYPSAYASARLHNWLKDMSFKIKENGYGPIHIVYVYLDEENKYAYVGATNDINRRDREHRDPVKPDNLYKHFIERGLKIPKPKVLRDGLTVIERQRLEKFNLYIIVMFCITL